MNRPVESSLLPYEEHDIRFLRPDIWEFEEVKDGDDIILTVSGENTCFWTLRILPECPAPTDAIESCVAAFRDDYDDIDVNPVETRLAGMPAVAREVEFECLELLNTVGLYSVRTADLTLLVWWQGTDHDLAEYRNLLDQMTQSVRILSLEGE